jgi:hypothetical protein
MLHYNKSHLGVNRSKSFVNDELLQDSNDKSQVPLNQPQPDGDALNNDGNQEPKPNPGLLRMLKTAATQKITEDP